MEKSFYNQKDALGTIRFLLKYFLKSAGLNLNCWPYHQPYMVK